MEEITKRLQVAAGIRLNYKLWGTAGQPRRVLVLLHGLASNLTRWSEFLEHTTLKREWDILRPDLRGHGRSMARCKLRMEIWCEDLLRLLDAEGRPTAVLVGHSLGAQLAVHFARRYPARVRGLALIDPILGSPSTRLVRFGQFFERPLRLLPACIRLLNRLGLHRRRIPQRDLRELDERTRAELLSVGHVEEMVSRYKSPWPDLQHMPTANFLEAGIEMVRRLPPLTAVSVPVLVVLSKSATYADPAVTRQAAAEFAQSETVAVDAYHWPLTERPKQTREAIEQWCERLT